MQRLRWRYLSVAFAAVLQLATVAYLGSTISGGDAQTYLRLSEDWTSWTALFSPDAFDANFWPAGYPGFLSLFAWSPEHQVLLVRVAQVGLAAAVALMAGRLADSVSQRSGTVTTVVVALSPTALWAVWAVGYELLLAFLLLAGLLLIWRNPAASRPWPIFLGGLLLGLALIVQFRSVLAVAVLLLFVSRRAFRVVLIALVGVALPVVAWAIRSAIAVGNPAPWSANGPYNLWNGNNPQATGHNVFPLPPLPDGSSSYTQAALTWIVDNPADFLVLTGKKFLFLFEPTRISGVSDAFAGEVIVSTVEFFIAGAICIGLIGFIVLRVLRKSDKLAAMDVPFVFSAAYLLPNVFFIVEARFAIPVHAILIAIAVSSLTVMAKMIRERQVSNVSTPAG